MLDRMTTTLLWREISSGARGSESMSAWKQHEEEHQEERVQALQKEIGGKSVESGDEKLLAKKLKELNE